LCLAQQRWVILNAHQTYWRRQRRMIFDLRLIPVGAICELNLLDLILPPAIRAVVIQGQLITAVELQYQIGPLAFTYLQVGAVQIEEFNYILTIVSGVILYQYVS
jgi:hypothetical protein